MVHPAAEYVYRTRIKLFHTFASFIIMVKEKQAKIHVENKKYTWLSLGRLMHLTAKIVRDFSSFTNVVKFHLLPEISVSISQAVISNYTADANF